ncbi:hypothetical protein J6590_043790 [Homalodisca vitripennis]|nr:hypothetical protein J6590_043790 [Homalodisca vitripennis]
MFDTLQTNGETSYKRVAVVERFFDIIYSIHVELEGRGGRHAGQKKTYRAITESYAFLPREAVTKFLLGCVECQRRSDVDLSTSDKSKTPSTPTMTPKHTNDTNTTLGNTNDSHLSPACDQTVPSSSSSANPCSEASPPRPRNPDTLHSSTHEFSCDSRSSYTQDLANKFEPESPLMTNFRHSSDESRTNSSGHDTLEVIKPDNAIDSFTETPKSVPVPVNLSMIRRRIPLNLPSLESKYSDKSCSVIKKSGYAGFSPDMTNLEHNLRLSTSTPDSNRGQSLSGSDTTISKSSDCSSGVELSPIEPEHFQKPYPKKLYTIHPTTFETIRIPLKHTEISIYYDKNKPYIKPKKRVDADSPLDAPILSTYLRYMRNLGYPDEESLKLDPEAEGGPTARRDPDSDR